MNKTNKFINDSNIILPQIKIYLCNRRLVKNWNNASPIRPHWRFYWNPEPGAEVSDENRKYCLDKNFILVIPPGVRVKQVIVKPCESLFVHAGFDLTISATANHLFTIPVFPAIMEIIKRLSNDVLNQSFVIGEFVFAVISRLPPGIWHSRINDPRIEKICRLLKKQPERAWANQELAVKACFSENAFIRRFREVVGISPQFFLQKLRLARAAALLLQNELSIEEIASACGFCDRHYLTRMFKKHFGQSPGRFRAGGNTP